jgi:hypothetical protein
LNRAEKRAVNKKKGAAEAKQNREDGFKTILYYLKDKRILDDKKPREIQLLQVEN